MIKKAIEILFPATKNVAEVVDIIEKYRHKFGLNTDLRLAMFLAQVREEIGSEFKVVRENLNYSPTGLMKTYRAFNSKLANEYGRSDDKKANQVVIANIAYANKLGNGNADSDGDGDMDADDDGWKYRGAGCLQITGKANFEEVHKRCLKYAGKEFDPDTLEGFIVFGMAYWIQHDLYRIADKGKSASVVDSITAKINYHTHSYANRVAHFSKIVSLIER